MYVCLSPKPCLISWIDLFIFLMKHINCIMKQATQMKKKTKTFHVSWQVFHEDLWRLIFPFCCQSWNEKKSTLVLISGTLCFFWTFLPPRCLMRVISVWVKLPNKWWRVWRPSLQIPGGSRIWRTCPDGSLSRRGHAGCLAWGEWELRWPWHEN